MKTQARHFQKGAKSVLTSTKKTTAGLISRKLQRAGVPKNPGGQSILHAMIWRHKIRKLTQARHLNFRLKITAFKKTVSKYHHGVLRNCAHHHQGHSTNQRQVDGTSDWLMRFGPCYARSPRNTTNVWCFAFFRNGNPSCFFVCKSLFYIFFGIQDIWGSIMTHFM